MAQKTQPAYDAAINQMMDPLEVSASAVDQLVAFEMANLEDQCEEQKIQHERLKRDELRNLE